MRAHEFIVEYKQYPTEEFNGLEFRMKEGDGQLTVHAVDARGKEIAYVEFDMGDNNELDPQDLFVDERYRNQGVAKTMYDYVKSKGYEIHRSWDQTDAGSGFWDKHRGENERVWEDRGQGAAGIILYAEDTGRYGLQQRSDHINDPGQWAAWGGGRKPDETLEQCATRELGEESGYTGPVKLKRLAENSKYVTFIGVIPSEFEPRANPEWKDYCWVEAGDWPAPMHPGVAAALKNIPMNENFADGKKATLREPFSKQVTIGDIELIAKSSGHNDLNIMAFVASDPNSPTIGMVKFWKDGSSLYSEKTTVLQDYQRQGIATLMYQFAKALGFNIAPSKEKTHLGQKLWKGFATKDSLSKKTIASKEFTENFADGKKPGRKGLAKRVGVNCKQPVSKLRSIAANSSGERQRMAHWCANMKSGKKK